MRPLPRVGHAEPVQDARLGHFHPARLAGRCVVVAGEMQRAMHDEVREVMRRPPARGGRLAPDHAERQHDLPRQPGAGGS